MNANSEGKILSVRIVNRTSELFHGQAIYVAAPTTEGSLGILPGRAPLLATLAAGKVELKLSENDRKVIEVGEGFLSVDDNHVTIVVDSL